MGTLIAQLFDGPVDIVGDIHGEIDALDALLVRLGYDRDGRHHQGRRLVFVGDLVDRGPDSPAVVERVAAMHAAGRAQCILGNHELNLLLGDFDKEGNGWFREADNDHDQAKGKSFHSARASDSQRRHFVEWFASLPLALERDDLRVVHACWHDAHIRTLRHAGNDIPALHRGYSAAIASQLEREGLLQQKVAERQRHGDALTDLQRPPPLLSALAAVDSRTQSAHPVKALTSGLEQATAVPFIAGGKWRMTERVAWWHQYDHPAAVVFGHYWRRPVPVDGVGKREDGPDLFEPGRPFDWLGRRGNALCVDWCVGDRWRERANGGADGHFKGRLGALRWNKREIVLDSD